VLLIHLEFPTWYQARHWSYASQLGIEEGFHANGVEYLTITTPWLCRAREICAGKYFDQVWLEIVHTHLDEVFLEWVSGLAPVRIGLMAESLTYDPREYTHWSDLKERQHKVENRLKYVTHVLAIDEKDANEINTRRLARAMWWPQAVPERFISEQAMIAAKNYAVFSGSVYGERQSWLEHPDLEGLIVRQAPFDSTTIYPTLFDTLHDKVSRLLNGRLSGQSGIILRAYLFSLRRIRRQCFALWLRQLRTGCAVVNLPHFLKAYSGRVIEGMAAGRPVISWDIPDRPQNKALFEDGSEILLYPKNNPGRLADHIRRILSDPELGQRIALNARRKLRRFHTIEKRVQQILNWVETGDEPTCV